MSIKLHICKLEIPNKQQILIRATDRLKLEAKKCAILIAVEKTFVIKFYKTLQTKNYENVEFIVYFMICDMK